MAEPKKKSEAPPARGGGVGTGKLGPLPVWGWALVMGGVLGGWWFLRNRSAAQAATDATGNGTGSDQPVPTIVPYDQGGGGGANIQSLSNSQFSQLLSAVQGLQGQLSTPAPQNVAGWPTAWYQPTPAGGIPEANIPILIPPVTASPGPATPGWQPPGYTTPIGVVRSNPIVGSIGHPAPPAPPAGVAPAYFVAR